MLSCPPNFNMFGQRARVWIMRGFYPNSTLFFKIVLMENSENRRYSDGGYYAKVSPLRTHFIGKGHSKYDDHTIFDGRELNEYLTNKMENALLGAKHELKPVMTRKFRMPRCQSPKGMKIFKLKRRRKSAKVD
jgi:hypothetical protein